MVCFVAFDDLYVPWDWFVYRFCLLLGGCLYVGAVWGVGSCYFGAAGSVGLLMLLLI